MSRKIHKTIAAFLNLLVVVGSFEVLISILNLNQPALFLRTAFYVGLFYILQIVLLYDLHYKNRGAFLRAKKKHESVSHAFHKFIKIMGSALWDRVSHLREANFVRQWFNYLILPGIIFWGSIAVFFVNFGFPKIQQIFVFLSSIALILNYWYLKEIFDRGSLKLSEKNQEHDKSLKVDDDVFVVLSLVKIYASALMLGACLALVRYYCLDAKLLFMSVFGLTFLLLYQALFQHQLINYKNLTGSLIIAFIMALASCVVLVLWGYNYFTAAMFLAALYNLLWGVFHYYLDRSLTWHAFWEILIVSAIVAGMVFSVTNFRAKLLDGCKYEISL
jgi:hypothetical protein